MTRYTALLILGTAAAFAQDARAEKPEWLDLNARIVLQYIGEENNDLGTNFEDYEDSFSQQFQLFGTARYSPNGHVFFYGRALNIGGDTGFDDDTGEAVALDDSFLELRELYIHQGDLFGVRPLYIDIGRQRLREPRAIWWNSDNDLVRLGYGTTLLNGFIAAGQNFSDYRTGPSDTFDEEDEDRFRVLGELSWQYRYNHFLEGRALYENDHSGTEDSGAVIDSDDDDSEDQELFWAGARATGKASRLRYRAELIGLAGQEDNLLSDPIPGSDNRLVTGSRERDVLAWAFDGGVAFDPSDGEGFVFSGNYSFASGDDDEDSGTSHEFRQTDLEGNSSRTGLERNQQRNFGEVLRPELSNIHIANLGAAYAFTSASDVSLNYYYYRLAEDATSLRSSGISAPLDGDSKDLGHAVDLGFYMDIDDEFSLKIPFVRDMDARIVLGSFFPGSAYEGHNEAFRIFSELKFRF